MEPFQSPHAPDSVHPLSTILYVGGFGRSGTTLIGRVLGEAPDAVCVGETRYLLSRGLVDNVQCGCGQPFRLCSFWDDVGKEGFGGWDQVDIARMTKIDRATVLFRMLPFHWAPYLRPGFAAEVREYASWLTRLYGAIARVSGAKTIVDTSKDPNFASLLTSIPGGYVRIIHLVRDSRAVAYSWTRTKRLPSPIGRQEFMPKFGPSETATRWLLSNLGFQALATRRPPYMRLNYEDFIANPDTTLRTLSTFAGQNFVLPKSHLEDSRVKLGTHHIFSGNPMRTNTGWLEMTVDDEWQTALPKGRFVEVTAITWPLLRLYGYPVVYPGQHNIAHSRAQIT